jgi:2-polyprenyl-3-methyl-5-hydroxy-6-metoxy-1,4-benzoquinol methylase
VFDVGCGTGALLASLSRRECRVEGLEYSAEALAYCRRRGLIVHKFDLERDAAEALPTHNRWDTVISMEVAEHLPPWAADRFLDLLSHLGDTIVFTAAAVGQGGTDHVNERPRSYWIKGFNIEDLRLMKY